MSTDKIIDKVKKLLRLSTSDNPNEAALAAAMAQKLIDQHQLDTALLALDGVEAETNEEIEDFGGRGAWLDEKNATWKGRLGLVIAHLNGCQVYVHSGRLSIIGRPSDVDTVRYLYGYLTYEVNRLANQAGKGCGRVWNNNYRLGVVDTIKSKLREQSQKFKDEARQAVGSNSQALVRVDQALAKIDSRSKEAAAWGKLHLNLRSRSCGRSQADAGARNAGREAGKSITINRAKRGLNSGGNFLNS